MSTTVADTKPAAVRHTDRRVAGRWLRKSGYRHVLPFLLPIVLVLVWDGLIRFDLVAPYLLPSPGRVIGEIAHLTSSGELGHHLGVSIARVGAGFILGAAAATIFGALTGYFGTWRLALDPTFQALRSLPAIAWVPLFILWLGIGEAPKVALIALGAFFPIYLNLMSGIAKVDRKLVEVGRVNRLDGWRLILRIHLPATLPFYLIGLRAGLGLSWMFVVAAELMGASEGIGFLLLDGQMNGRPDRVIAAMTVFAVVGKLTDMILAGLSNRLLRWQDAEER